MDDSLQPATVEVSKVRELWPELFISLERDAEREGFQMVRRLLDEWQRGDNTFSLEGEALFVATRGGKVLGVCGLNRDPYATDSRTGRVRRLYVASMHRRQGIGRRLVEAVIAAAEGQFNLLRLRTGNPLAARFYESLGFQPVNSDSYCSHIRRASG